MKKQVCLALLLGLFLFVADTALAWRGEVGWTFRAETGISSGVAVSDAMVVFGDTTGTLYAVRRASGQLAWSYHGTNTIVGTPALAGDKVFFAQEDGTLTCLNLSNGSEAWRVLSPESGSGADTMVDGAAVGDGKVFVSKGDGKLYALSAANGATVWTYRSDQELRSAPTFGEGYVFLGEQNGKLSFIDPKTGKRVTGGGAGGPINTPAVSDGTLFFSSWDGSVQGVKLKGVVPQWKTNVQDSVTTAPFVSGGKVFVGTARGNVAALDARSGKILWQFNTQGGSVSACPICAEGLVFAGGGQGVLSILDARTGKLRSTFTTGTGIVGTPAYDGGVLYLGSGDGNLYAIM